MHDLLSDKYEQRNDITNVKKLTQETERIQEYFSQTHSVAAEQLESRRVESFSIVYCASQRTEELHVEERKARERAKRLYAKAEKERIEDEFAPKNKTAGASPRKDKETLQIAKENVKENQLALETEISEELGLEADLDDKKTRKTPSGTDHSQRVHYAKHQRPGFSSLYRQSNCGSRTQVTVARTVLIG